MAITARFLAPQSEVCPSARRASSSILGGAERSKSTLAARADIAKHIDGRELVFFASKQVAELILAIVALVVLTLTTLALGLPAHLYLKNAHRHRGGPAY